MPTYEYECESCGLKFEQWQGIHDPPVVDCPDCSGKVNRLISGGGGFFLKSSTGTPYRDGGGCALEQTGRTCCGRIEQCGSAPCGEES